MNESRLDPIRLAELGLDLQYVTNAEGLILAVRDPEVPPPLLQIIRTVAGNRWLLAASISPQHRTAIDAALRTEPVISDHAAMEHNPPLLAGIRDLLASLRPELPEYRGPAFLFPESLPPSPRAEILHDYRNATAVPELAWIRDAQQREEPIAVARNEAGEVISVCHSARSTTGAAAAGLATAAAYRGRGLAVEVTSAWARAVRDEGRLPVYGCRWENAASRAVARKLGLIQFGEDYAIG